MLLRKPCSRIKCGRVWHVNLTKCSVCSTVHSLTHVVGLKIKSPIISFVHISLSINCPFNLDVTRYFEAINREVIIAGSICIPCANDLCEASDLRGTPLVMLCSIFIALRIADFKMGILRPSTFWKVGIGRTIHLSRNLYACFAHRAFELSEICMKLKCAFETSHLNNKIVK